MDKHEYRAKTEEMLGFMSQKSYKQAMNIADVIDWRRVKNTAMLCAVSEIYEYNGEYEKSRDILFLAYDRSPESRKIIYRLGTLAIKLGDLEEANDCYEEFLEVAPRDPNQYVLKYKILKAQQAPIQQQIEALESFKRVEYVEKWAYELAVLYDKAGMSAECLEECDDLILWFSEGKYVYKAMELKMLYKPLTPLQQEKYNHRNVEKEEVVAPVQEATEEVVEEIAEEKEEEAVEEIAEETAEEAPEEIAEEKEEEAVEEIAEETAEEAPEEIAEETAEEAPEEIDEETAEEAPEEIVEETAEEAVEETVEEAPTQKLSIEEMLQSWEMKQKENAEIIRAEFEKVEQEKVELEKDAVEEKPEILSEDVRKLMEELETEAADIAAQKAIREEETVVEETLIQKVAKQLKSLDVMSDEKEDLFEDFDISKKSFVEEEPAQEPAVLELEELPAIEIPEEVLMDEELEEEELDNIKALEQVVSHLYESPEFIEEAPGIKLGDTQSMAAVAKALKNNVEVELPEDNPVQKKKIQNPYDTGFIVQGRYDLDAQSEVGLKAGLTEEQKKLFSYFVPVRGMSEQIVQVLQDDKKCKSRYGTSRIGNLLIIGRKGSGKTVLAVDIVKAIQKARKLKQGKVGIVTADSLNKKSVEEILEKLFGGAIIIEKASHLSRRTIEDMCDIMEGQTGEMLVVLEDERKPLERLLEQYPQFKKKFTSRIELPVFINDELVTFGQTYAKENGYKIDEMGILALYSKIDLLQREEKVVTVTDVKEILDQAIENSQKSGFKKFMKKMLGKNKDESERIILREEDFK